MPLFDGSNMGSANRSTATRKDERRRAKNRKTRGARRRTRQRQRSFHQSNTADSQSGQSKASSSHKIGRADSVPEENQFLNEDFGWEEDRSHTSEGVVSWVRGANQIQFSSINLPDFNLVSSLLMSPLGQNPSSPHVNTQLTLQVQDVVVPTQKMFLNPMIPPGETQHV